ncbi:MAG: TIGR02594 family protein, partial [Pseudomonadota bacterium]
LLEAPAPGAVVTFWRKRKDGPYGHSAFAVGRNSQGHIMCLGGNQGNRVSIRPFAVSRVLSYRWPKTHAVPDIGFETLPLLNSDGVVSSDEA